MRVLWTLAELRLTFDHVPVAWDDPGLKSADFLALNPAGAIPTLVDGDFAIGESLAINLYLARAYGAETDLELRDLATEANAWRWSLWAQGHLEPWVQRDVRLADRLSGIGSVAAAMASEALRLLERRLADTTWLSGTAFGVADLNVAAVLSPSRAAVLRLGPATSAWLGRCYSRPAAVDTRRRYSLTPD